MNTKSVRIGRAIVLSILFFVTCVSLLAGHHGHPIHVIAGFLLLIGSAVHMRTKRQWFNAVLSRPASELTPRARQLRRTALWLIGLSFLCAGTGIGQLVVTHGSSTGPLGALHDLSGGLMILVIGIHLFQHRDWLVNVLRQPAGLKKETVAQE